MGNCCCDSQSPCGSAEESRGLLNDEQKATAGTGETVVVGPCAPEEDNDMRRNTEDNQEKQNAETGETSTTQGNGPLPKESLQTQETASPREVSENGTRAQNKDETSAHCGQAEQAELLQCTLNSLESRVLEAPDAKPEEESPASEKNKNPDGCLPAAELVCADNRTDTNTEHIAESAALHRHEEEEEEEENAPTAVTVYNVAAKPSEETAQNNEVLSVPNSQLAEAAGPMSSISVVSETKTEPQSCPVTDNSDNSRSPVCREVDREDVNSHDVSRSSPGREPDKPVHSGEEWSASYVQQPQTTAAADASEGSESDPKCTTTHLRKVTSLEKFKLDVGEEERPKVQDKEEDVPRVKENDGMKAVEVEEEEVVSAPTAAETESGKDAEIQETGEKQEEPPGSPAKGGKPESEPAAEGEEDLDFSEEDLYRGAEELSACHSDEPEPLSESETKCLKLEDRCSLAPAVDILYYSEREWKGNTAKSALIKKGYKEMSQRFGSVRRVRGDNYCALRATLFQVLSNTTKLPVWLQEDDVVMLPKQLEAQEGLISQWTFPGECLQGDGTGDATQQLKSYMELLRNKWQAAVDCGSAAERQQLCEQLFLGGEEELGLLEALKLLMLARAVELHGCMQSGEDVPLFCWLLFARDSSDCPQSFLSNHLRHVGLTAGLEQVEMFLLGYALQCTIQVYRLYKADTEEFVTYYPDDHKDDWESVCLVTEDDRHYNVPVAEAAELHRETPSS